MTDIIVVRHGQSVANELDKFAGFDDYDLTDLGRKQAELCAEYIKEHYKIDAVYASDLKRAYNTALATAKAFGLDVNAREAFREIKAGIWESLDFADIYKYHLEAFALWAKDVKNAYCPDGETVRDVFARVKEEYLKIVKENDGKTILIAAHATPVRAIQCISNNCDVEEIGKFDNVGNASVNHFRYENGSFREIVSNITEHLGEYGTFLPSAFNQE